MMRKIETNYLLGDTPSIIERLEAVAKMLEGCGVQVLCPKPGSTIVLRHPSLLKNESMARIKESCKRFWPDCKIVVMEQGMSVEAVFEPAEGK